MTDTRPPVAPVEGLVEEMSSLLHATFLNNLLRHTDVPHENRMLIQSQMNDFAAQLAQPFIERIEDLEASLGQCSQDNGDWTYENQLLKAKVAELASLADAACDYADSHCRAFPIATAPKSSVALFYGFGWVKEDYTDDNGVPWHYKDATHWSSIPKRELPAVFTDLGAALEKIKGA
jgi:hypothetical protein